jgi:hypothetical protein
MADLSALLAELGGDNPQNRAIAEGLQKQGIASTKDIGVRKVPVAGHFEGTDEAAHYVPETTENAYFNKATGKEVNPTRVGIYDVKDGDKTQGNIFFHLNADDNGNVSFHPQWSPRAHGFLRDNAVGRLIMTAGKIIPSPFQAGFVAADVADKLAHGKVMQAVASAIPYGIQQLAQSAEVLQNIAGNSDFVATAKTAAGKIAEAAGAPSYAADLAGKVATSGITAGLTGGDVGAAMLKAGATSLLGDSKEFLKSAGDFSKMGIGGLLPEGISASDFDSKALGELGETLEDLDVSPQDITPNWEGKGWGEIGEGEFADEIRPAFDLTGRDNIEDGIGSLNNQTTNALEGKDAKGLQSLYEQENPGAANVDVETANTVRIDGKEYFLDDQGGAATQNPDGSYTHLNAREFNDLGSPDEVDSDGTLDTVTVTGGNGVDSVSPVAYDDEGNLMPGYELDSEGNAVWMGGGSNYVTPEGEGMVDDGGTFTVSDGGTAYIDPYEPLQLPPGADPDEAKPEEPYLLNPDEEPPPPGKPELKVPPVFPPKITPPKGPGGYPLPKDGLDDIVKGLVGGTVVGKVIDGFNKDPEPTPTTPALADPLKGNYNFSWNKQQTKGPEKGVAYGQRYYGNHWSQQAPAAAKTEPKETTPVERLVALPSPVEDRYEAAVMPQTFPVSPTGEIQFAEGGLMALDKTTLNSTFKPTMSDGGIQASDITKQDLTNQVIQHMRRGGHVIDHKTHKDVHYLASKGEPVHHIVGFMNHRKRMAEGGITSHSLGSYSDGGHLLKGPGDGMSDDIPATIADKQPARLANEEFVIPADVVSHLGNGSSESGAKVLYDMMARIRKARTGNPKQGKQIDPHKLLPKV